MSCKGYYIADFASYLIVENTMNVQNLSSDEVPLSIAVNTNNLHAYIHKSDYCPIGGIAVPNPCNITQSITVPCVTLTELRIDGVIGYYVGADVLDPTPFPDVVIEPDDVKVLYTASVAGNRVINDEVIDILDNPSAVAPELKVTVTRVEVAATGDNENGEHFYLINGEFKIEPVNEPEI
ncbi:hypothetical protein [Romboutsia sp.]|uniref:hypothetical protein n=1 Tax=Romboutsia sp. TaxID=1965302 RepID=UPI003F3599AC